MDQYLDRDIISLEPHHFLLTEIITAGELAVETRTALCWQRWSIAELAVENENCLFGHSATCWQRSIPGELAVEYENCLFGHSTACQKSIAGELAVENENHLFGHITAVDPDQSVNSPLKMKNALNFWPQHYLLTDQSLMNSPFKMRTALLATALSADWDQSLLNSPLDCRVLSDKFALSLQNPYHLPYCNEKAADVSKVRLRKMMNQ